MGWNFYGFFLFAAIWIAAYFVWARWMTSESHEQAQRRKDPSERPFDLAQDRPERVEGRGQSE